MITAGAGVIDWGINRGAGNRVGDVAREPAVAAAITPVPASAIPSIVAMRRRTTLPAFTSPLA